MFMWSFGPLIDVDIDMDLDTDIDVDIDSQMALSTIWASFL